MSCIAGTVDKPLTWIRFRAGEASELEGRVCDRTQPFTNRRACSSCPAYRGTRWDGSASTGLAPNGDPLGLTPDEYAEWQHAKDAALIDDDFEPLARFEDRLAGQLGERALLRIGDPEAMERWATYMRGYRSSRAAAGRERDRAGSRERMRRMRLLRKQPQKPPAGSV